MSTREYEEMMSRLKVIEIGLSVIAAHIGVREGVFPYEVRHNDIEGNEKETEQVDRGLRREIWKIIERQQKRSQFINTYFIQAIGIPATFGVTFSVLANFLYDLLLHHH